MLLKPRNYDSRTRAQIQEHYRVEKELAEILRTSQKEQRRHLYRELYDELFRRVPHHPSLSRSRTPEQALHALQSQLAMVQRYLSESVVFLELGPGNCNFSVAMTEHVKKVYAVDVSRTIADQVQPPDNFELIISDGSSIPLPDSYIDVAFSNQLMEHLHPDDALIQLNNVVRVLKPGGTYICVTPNRLSGPHDVSGQFDDEATGFHLKEYTCSDLARLFCEAGFSNTRSQRTL